MADKSFGVKKIELLGDGTPTIESPNDLNLNANTVAISTNLNVGNRVSVSSGVVTSISGVVTYYGDGQYLTGLTASPNVVGTSLSISGISTLGVTSVTDLTAQDLDVSGIASVGAAITMYGATGIISATQFYGDGSELTGIGAATTANITAETLKVTGVSTLGVTSATDFTAQDLEVSGIATFQSLLNANGNVDLGGDSNDTISVNGRFDTNLVPSADTTQDLGQATGPTRRWGTLHVNNIDALGISSVGAAITMYGATGIISATKFFGDGSDLSGVGGIGANDNINTTGIITASAFAGFKYLQAPFGSTTTFTVTVASKDATHRYNGTGSSNAYLINGVQAPVLTLTPGRTYRFTNDNTGSHPFKFYYEADRTTLYTTGVNFQNSYTEITVSDTTPNVLHYQCTAHPYMGNAVITNSNVVDSPYPATLRDGLSVTGISSVGSAITMYGATGIVSATKFIGDGSSLTGITADTLGDLASLKVTGLSTFAGDVDINADVDISGNLSIGGTLTYEDVTNVDSIGLITARDGIAVLGSGVTVTGLSTFYSDLNVGSAITMLSSSGIVSATKFYGDGSNLSGISADTIGDLSKLVVTGIATFQSNIGVAGSVTTDLLRVGYSTSLKLAYQYYPGAHQVGTDDSSSTLGIFRFSADDGAPSVRFIKSRSTDPSGKGIVQNGDELGTIFFIGDDGNDFSNGGAAIKATVDGTPSATADMPTKLSFHTALDGSSNAKERLTIRNTGDVGIGTIDPTGTAALTNNDAVLAVGVVTATQFFGDGSQLTGVGGGTSPGQVAFASTAGISTLTSSWTVVPDGSNHFQLTGPGNLSSANDPTIYLQRGQIYEFVINSNSSHPFQIRKTDNSAYTDGVTYTGSGGTNSIYDGTVRFDVPFDAPAELKYVCTNHSGDMVGVIYVTDAAGQGGPTDVADFQNLKVSAASTLGSVKVSSGIITATSGIVTFYGDGQYLTGITAEGTGAIGGLTVKDEGSTVGTAGSVATLNFVGDIVSAAANTGAAGVATVTVSVKDAQENIYLGTNAGNASDTDTCYNVALGYKAGASLDAGDENVFLGCCAGTNATSGSNNVFLGSVVDTGVVTGSHNVAIGNDLLGNLTSGTKSVAIGYGLLNTNSTTASCNIAIGADSLLGVDSTAERNISLGFNNLNNFLIKGDDNIAIGYCAGISYCNTCHTNIAIGHSVGNCAGRNNISMGKYVGESYTSGHHNIGLGECILPVANTGAYNIAFGSCAGCSLTSGSGNILFGCNAGNSLLTGGRNIIFGDNAGTANICGQHNITIGCKAMSEGSGGAGDCNIALGFKAGLNLSGAGANHNVFLGSCVANTTTTGGHNIALGYDVELPDATGNCQLAIGNGTNRWISGDSSFNTTLAGIATVYSATGIVSATKFCGDGSALTGTKFNRNDDDNNLFAGVGAGGTYTGGSTSCYNLALGYAAMGGLCNDIGGTTHNIAFGLNSGYALNGGDHNFLGGYESGKGLTSGCRNIFIGRSAGRCQTTTVGNIYLGMCAGHQGTGGGTGGDYNIGIGYKAAEQRCTSTSTCNIAIGYEAGFKGKGKDNVALGKHALYGGIFCGCFNIGIGNSAGHYLDDGNDNVLLGREAGKVIEDGSDNIVIGRSAGFNIRDADDNVFVGERAGVWTCNGCRNVMLGARAGGSLTRSSYSTGNYNNFIGYCAGAFTCAGIGNIFNGPYAGADNTSGSYNIAIGAEVCLPNTTGSCQLAIGVGANNRWITGDNSFNVTLAGIATAYASGIVSATKFCGDGSKLTGIVTATGINTTTTSTFNDLTVTGVSTFLGSVGIGTTNTNHYNLRVDAGTAKSAFQVVGSTGTLLDVVNDATSDIFSANDVSGINAFKINKDRLITMALVGAGDSVGIGTTLPRSSSKLDVEGIVKATSYLGDGSTLDNVGFTQDSQGNLVAGTGAGASKDADTCYNIILGCNAGTALNEGDYNVLMGLEAGKCITSGSHNFVFGPYAGCSINSGSSNFLVGYGVGKNITTGCKNIAFLGGDSMGATACCNIVMGNEAGYNLTGNSNIALGAQAGCDLTGSDNILLGGTAGTEMTSGSCNIAVGKCAMKSGAVTGNLNIAIGYRSGDAITSATNNVLIGCDAGRSLTTSSGLANVFIGRGAGASAETGCFSVAIGCGTLNNMKGLGCNIAFGRRAGQNMCTGTHNFFAGNYTAQWVLGGNNIAIGQRAMQCMTNVSDSIALGEDALVGSSTTTSNTGDVNIAIGPKSSNSMTTGACNITIGRYAGCKITTGCQNIAIGKNALLNGTTTGSDNIVMGEDAGCKISSANFNVAIGHLALSSGTVTGNANIAIGEGAGKCVTSGDNNILIGCYAGCAQDNRGQTIAIGYYAGRSGANACGILMGFATGQKATGNCNIMIGPIAGPCTTTGCGNIFIGEYVGKLNCEGKCNIFLGACTGCSNTNGDNNIAIGCMVQLPVADGDCQFAIGQSTNRWISGDSSFNTTLAGIATVYSATGIVSATKFCGDGSALTGLAGFSADSQENLYAGTGAGAASDSNTCFNVGIGYSALTGLTGTSGNPGNDNVAIGRNAGAKVTDGCRNILIGMNAGCCATSSKTLTAVGHLAARDFRTGSYNAFFGSYAGMGACSGSRNTAVGSGALKNVGCAGNSNQNTAVGANSGRCTQNACYNTFVGAYAGGGKVVCGNRNTTVGYKAGCRITSGLGNVFIGQYGGSGADLTGEANIAIGDQTGKCITSGAQNIILGCTAGFDLTEGSRNVIIGQTAGANLTTGNENIAIGCGALGTAVVTGQQNIIMGKNAGTDITTGSYNIIFGRIAAQGLTEGQGNIAMGTGTLGGDLATTVTGINNIMIGNQTAVAATSACCNVLIGHLAGHCISEGSENIMLGRYAGNQTTTGDNNIIIGTYVCASSATASGELAIGCQTNRWICGDSSFNVTIAGIATVSSATGIVSATKFCGDGSALTNISAGFTTTGSNNLVAGYNAGCNIASGGCNNVILGTEAGKNLTTADSNVFIGMYAGCSFTDNGIGANVYIGCNAGRNAGKNGSQIAFYNVALGYGALWGDYSNGSGTCHTIAIGNMALACSTTGMSNVAIGHNAGCKSSTAGKNFLGGYYAGRYNTTGGCNVYIGGRAAQTNQTGVGNVVIGNDAACSATNSASCNFSTSVIIGQFAAKKIQGGSNNVVIGEYAGCNVETPYGNVFIGAASGKCNSTGYYNTLIGNCAGCNDVITGCCNIAIGHKVQIPSPTSDLQLAIGCRSCNWIVGNSNWNVGIGTTNPDAAVGVGNTAKLSVGILSAYQLYGDGSNLSGLAGFSQDSQGNLVAGTGAGAAKDADTCFNIILGCNAGLALNEGDHNIIMGCHAGCAMTTSTDNVALGRCAMCGHTTGHSGNGRNVAIGIHALADSNCFDNIGIGGCAGCGKTGETVSYKKSIFIGDSAGAQTAAGNCNIFVGHYAGKGNDTGGISGDDNIAIGQDAGCTISSGKCNILIGKLAGKLITTGCLNVITGPWAGSNAAITGTYNNVYGYAAGYNITSGQRNNAFGNGALYGLTTGRCNIGIGPLAGYAFDVGCRNILMGYAAGCKISGGNENIAIGKYAMNNGVVTGEASIAIGNNALYSLTSGICNIAIGVETLYTVTNGCCNVAMGVRAGRCLTSGNDNVFLGFYAGENVTTGSENVYVGKGAGPITSASEADHNAIFGIQSGSDLTTGCCNVFIGYRAAQGNTSGERNVFIGGCTGPLQGNDASGKNNFGSGWRSLCCLTTGCDNIVIGKFAARKITSGKYNIAFGEEAMSGHGTDMMTGSHNVSMGKASSYNLTSGNHNFVAGLYAFNKNATGSKNVAIGENSQQNRCSGNSNISMGYYSLIGTTSATDNSGSYNLALGEFAGRCVCVGNSNVMLGYKAGCNIESGSMNIMIGCNVCGSANNVDKEIVLGYDNSAVGRGTRTFLVHSDSGVYHGGNTTTWDTTSDLRIKKNVTNNNIGLDKIKEVQVRNFEYRTKDEITDFENPSAVVVNKEGIQLGVIAQEIQQVLPETVTQQSTGALSVNADNLTWYLINAVKELSAKNDALEERIKKLEGS